MRHKEKRRENKGAVGERERARARRAHRRTRSDLSYANYICVTEKRKERMCARERRKSVEKKVF